SYRPPHDERRRLRASVVARLGGGAARPGNACAWRGRERVSHQRRSLPNLWLMIVGSWRLATHAWSRSVTSSVPTWLELGVWLTRSLPRYAARNFSIEKM